MELRSPRWHNSGGSNRVHWHFNETYHLHAKGFYLPEKTEWHMNPMSRQGRFYPETPPIRLVETQFDERMHYLSYEKHEVRESCFGFRFLDSDAIEAQPDTFSLQPVQPGLTRRKLALDATHTSIDAIYPWELGPTV